LGEFTFDIASEKGVWVICVAAVDTWGFIPGAEQHVSVRYFAYENVPPPFASKS
jgi:hypothetical protein